jgi:hypothetical protein
MAVSAILLAAALAGMGSGAEPANGIPPCGGTSLCELKRPEDIVPIDGTAWLAINQSDRDELLLYRPDKRTMTKVSLANRPQANSRIVKGSTACPAPPAAVKMRGIDAVRLGGMSYLAIVNHGKPTRIEFFTIEGRAEPALLWAGCIPVPEQYQLNDLAIAPNGTVFASHMFDMPIGEGGFAALQEDFRLGRPTGYAVHWSEAGGWQRVDGSDVSFANGIAVSRDGQTLALAGTYSQGVWLIPIQRSGDAVFIPLRQQPDNISQSGRSGFTVAGHIGRPLIDVAHCRANPDAPCAFRFSVVEISPTRNRENISGFQAVTAYCHTDLTLPGASVAVRWRKGYFLGTSFGDRVTYVVPPKPVGKPIICGSAQPDQPARD